MNDAQDGESGQFVEKYGDEAFTDALAVLDGAGSTAEIAEHVGCPRRTAYGRLDDLATDGEIGKRNVGAGVLWTLTGGEGE